MTVLDLTHDVQAIFTEITEELATRFPGLRKLSQRDRIAIVTAISKAIQRGATYGILAHVQTANEMLPVDERVNVPLHTPDTEPDLWAQKYSR